MAVAREKARDALLLAAKGVDPAAEKQSARRAARQKGPDLDLFSHILSEFLQRHVRKNRSAAETDRLFRREVLPYWGDKRIQDISKRDVHALLDGIVDRGRGTTANRTLAAVRRLFNWCLERDILAASPCAGVKPPAVEVSRDRVLSDKEIRWLWQACEVVGYPFGTLTKLLLITAQREEEVGGAVWSEFNFADDGPSWLIPPQRAKNRREHLVPLSPLALGLVQTLPSFGDAGDWLFTTNGRSPVSGYSRAKKRLDETMLRIAQQEAELAGRNPAAVAIPRWTFHDLRRTAATGMQRAGVPIYVVEAVLNHKSGSVRGVAAVYGRYSYNQEKSFALTPWASSVIEVLSSAGGGNFRERSP